MFSEKNSDITFTKDPQKKSKEDYVVDRTEFILNNIAENSIFFIDGPLIGGQITSYTLKLVKKLLAKGVVPVFFVKNSASNLVVDNLRSLGSKFNSDLHWANSVLARGQRTNFFRYVDQVNPNNAKIFCYIRSFTGSPQRIEVDTRTFLTYKSMMPRIMNLAFYLLLLQGDPRNPQLRSIAVAEKYAREMLKMADLKKMARSARLTPTINQDRFAWN